MFCRAGQDRETSVYTRPFPDESSHMLFLLPKNIFLFFIQRILSAIRHHSGDPILGTTFFYFFPQGKVEAKLPNKGILNSANIYLLHTPVQGRIDMQQAVSPPHLGLHAYGSKVTEEGALCPSGKGQNRFPHPNLTLKMLQCE